MIERDLLCARCGYNLRGLSAEGLCPECGKHIGETLELERRARGPAVLNRLRYGAWIWLWTHALFLVAARIWDYARPESGQLRYAPAALLGNLASPVIAGQDLWLRYGVWPKDLEWAWSILSACTAVLWTISCWLLTSADLPGVPRLLRRVVRWGATVLCLAIPVRYAQVHAGTVAPYLVRLGIAWGRALDPLLGIAVALLLLRLSARLADSMLEFLCVGLLLFNVVNCGMWATLAVYDYLAMLESPVSIALRGVGAVTGGLFFIAMYRLAQLRWRLVES
jgi:hypothetical protein